MAHLAVFSLAALTEGYVGALQESGQGSSVQIRRRKASGDPYWAYSGESNPVELMPWEG